MLFFLMMIDSDEERSKFEIIYNNYRNLMFFVAKNILNNDSDAEDAVHDAFLKIIKILEKIEDPECHKTKNLVVIITKRVAIDILRAKTRHETIPDSEGLFDNILRDEASVRAMETVEETIDIAHAISKLPDRYREVIFLRFYNDYSNREIAEILNISEANVRKLLERARNKLSSLLGEDGD